MMSQKKLSIYHHQQCDDRMCNSLYYQGMVLHGVNYLRVKSSEVKYKRDTFLSLNLTS